MKYLAFFFLLQISAANACRLSQDTIFLYEKGSRVGDRSAFLAEDEKGGSARAGWIVCTDAICSKRRGIAPASAGPNDLVLCHMRNGRSAFDLSGWLSLSTNPGQECEKPEWAANSGENNEKKSHCHEKLYGEFMKAQLANCNRIVVPLPEKDLGLIASPAPRNTEGYTPGPGENCNLADRCLRVDIESKAVSACSPGEK